MYANQLDQLRSESLHFELYKGNQFITAKKGTAETLETYLNACQIESYTKMGNEVVIHFK